MQYETDFATPTLATGSDQNSLYRLTLVGGPFDGQETQSDDPPETDLQLPSGPASDSAKAAPGVMPYVARYKLASGRLVMSCHVPIVLFRFEYCGTVTVGPSRCSLWWRRRLDAFGRWFKRRPSPGFGHYSRRSYVHVQD